MKHLTLLLAILLLTGCVGSKSKVAEKQKQKTELAIETETKKEEAQVTTEEKNQVKTTDSIVEIEKTEIFSETIQDRDIVADSTGSVTIEVEKTDKGYIQRYTGVSIVNLRDKTTKEETTLKERIELLKTDSITKVKNDSIVKSEYSKELLLLEQEIKNLKSEKEKKTGSIWLCILPWAIIILYIVWKNRKRIFVGGG
tara:strand:- start:4552 stop:5145 length:594 start_codon:yes stop_codon:yes gene_type:complete